MLEKFNEIGKKYGKLTVIRRAENYKKNGSVQWYCVCNCGNPKEIKVRAHSLRCGHTKSCGCLVVEKTKETHTNKTVSQETKKKMSEATKGQLRNHCMSDIGKKYPYRGKYERGSFVVRRVNHIINGARKRNLDVTISKEEIAKMIVSSCSYCGKPSNLEGHREASGIDRVDNSKGYVINNCVPCCFYCNCCKNIQTLKEFKKHIVNMYETMIVGKKDASTKTKGS